MRSRAARNSLAAVAALCILALPGIASASSGSSAGDHGRGQEKKAESTADGSTTATEPTTTEQTAAEPSADASTAKGNNGQARKEPAAKQPKRHAKAGAAPTTEPQPKSNADLNPGGANNGGDCGAYCSTRDGSPSKNGNGGGGANGKPCAGCVGKADNKNPPGQAPDGSDHNNGYECDGNKGVGKTNPAHTGCKPSPSTSPSPSPCVPTNDNPCEPCVPTNDNPCEPCVPTNDNPCEPCVPTDEEPCESPTPEPSVSASESEKPSPSVSASVKGVKIVRPRANPPAVAGGRLPTTGANASVALLLLVGLGLVVLGISMTVATPARHHS